MLIPRINRVATTLQFQPFNTRNCDRYGIAAGMGDDFTVCYDKTRERRCGRERADTSVLRQTPVGGKTRLRDRAAGNRPWGADMKESCCDG